MATPEEILARVRGQQTSQTSPESADDILARIRGQQKETPPEPTLSEKIMADLKLLKNGVVDAGKGVLRGSINATTALPVMAEDTAVAWKNYLTGSDSELPSTTLQRTLDEFYGPNSTPTAKGFQLATELVGGAKMPSFGGDTPGPSGPLAETVSVARKEGYVVPPSQANKSKLSQFTEWLSGKKALLTDATERNLEQASTNLADDIGAKGFPLSEHLTEATRADAGKAYARVQALGPRWHSAIEFIKENRSKAQAFDREAARNYNVAAVNSAKEFRDNAAAMEDVVEQTLASIGKPELYDDYVAARKLIAKTYDIDRGLVRSTGGIKPVEFTKTFAKDKPQSGAIEALGRVSQAFPKAFATKEPYMAVKDVAMAAGPGVAAATVMHDPKWALYGLGLAGGQYGLRKAILSEPVQDLLLLSPEQKATAMGDALTRTAVLANTPDKSADRRRRQMSELLRNK